MGKVKTTIARGKRARNPQKKLRAPGGADGFSPNNTKTPGPPKDPFLLEPAPVRILKKEMDRAYKNYRGSHNTIADRHGAMTSLSSVRHMTAKVLEAARIELDPEPEVIETQVPVLWPWEQLQQAISIAMSWTPDTGQFAHGEMT